MSANIEQYLNLLQQQNASDLYLTVGLPPTLRVDEQLLKTNQSPLTAENIDDFIKTLLSETESQQWQTQREVDLAYTDTNDNRYRVNIYQQRNQPAVVIRPITMSIPSTEALGLPSILEKLILKKQGLVLFVGSTGVGKSTSMASLINYRNQQQAGHIITVEDPIEFVYQHDKSIISQREIGTDTESFASALKSILRERPDMVQVGEIRDQESMEYVLQLASTGHLVLSTLHANSADQAIERIVSFFPQDQQQKILLDLSLTLSAIVAQRMLTDAEGKKCVAFELLLANANIQELIKNHNISGIKEAIGKANNQAMFTFDQYLLELYQVGKITKEEALHNADSENDLSIKIKLAEGKRDDEELKIR